MSSYEKYAAIRNSKGLTDYRVAKDTGIGTATLSNWKSGNYKPKQEKINIIARYLGVDPSEISDIEERKKNTIKVYHSANISSADRNSRRIGDESNQLNTQSYKKEQLQSKIFEITKLIVDEAVNSMADDDPYWIISLFSKLNEEGKNKLYDYLEDLLLIGKYTETGEPYVVNWEERKTDIKPNLDSTSATEADYEKAFGIQSEQESHVSNTTEDTQTGNVG